MLLFFLNASIIVVLEPKSAFLPVFWSITKNLIFFATLKGRASPFLTDFSINDLKIGNAVFDPVSNFHNFQDYVA